MKDIYQNFAELAANEREGIDYVIHSEFRDDACLVLAIHGDGIEPGTTEIARNISGNIFSFYSFCGKRHELHLTSAHFDEPVCLALVAQSKRVISIHGKKGDDEFVMIGGLDEGLAREVHARLQKIGFRIENPPPELDGHTENNICNRGLSKKGVQLELSRGLRDRLLSDELQMSFFCTAIRDAVFAVSLK